MCSTYRMHIARPKQFPRFLVAALLAANGLLWAVMFFGPLAHLERLASGLTPFDIRPRGYSYAEARAFCIDNVASVAYQASNLHKITHPVDGGESIERRQMSQLDTPTIQKS